MSYKPPHPSPPKTRTASRVMFDFDGPKSSASSRAVSDADLRVRETRRNNHDGGFEEAGHDGADDSDTGEMGERRPPYHRTASGRSAQPLLYRSDEERGRATDSPTTSPVRPTFSRRSTMRSRSPADPQALLETKKKYTYAAFFLGVSLVSFVIQTETAVYIQRDLGWDKAYCMLYVPLPFSSVRTQSNKPLDT